MFEILSLFNLWQEVLLNKQTKYGEESIQEFHSHCTTFVEIISGGIRKWWNQAPKGKQVQTTTKNGDLRGLDAPHFLLLVFCLCCVCVEGGLSLRPSKRERRGRGSESKKAVLMLRFVKRSWAKETRLQVRSVFSFFLWNGQNVRHPRQDKLPGMGYPIPPLPSLSLTHEGFGKQIRRLLSNGEYTQEKEKPASGS